MGSEEHKEMLFWTGIRCGELLALGISDFNFDRQELTINKSYQRLKGRDVITSPKTKKSNRTIKLPKFLCEEMQEYIVRRLQYRDVVARGKEFLTEYKAAKAEYNDYRSAVAKWERQTGNRAEPDSLKARLKKKQQEVMEQENNRQSHRYRDDRGGR